MAHQLIFDLSQRAALGREDFFVAPSNALALATLDAPSGWPAGKMLLIGPEGAGKTHLAALWAGENRALIVAAASLGVADAPRLAAARAVVVEDVDRIGSNDEAQRALFHLHNLLAAEGGRLLLTAASAPRDWGLSLPDLASRMQATASVKLDPPDDALLAAVLVKLFADRQITVTPALIPWLVTRIDRSLATARKVVAALDERALQKAAPVSRTLAAEVLDSLE